MTKKLKDALVNDKRGAGLTEYLILVGLIAIVCFAIMQTFGTTLKTKATSFNTTLQGL